MFCCCGEFLTFLTFQDFGDPFFGGDGGLEARQSVEKALGTFQDLEEKCWEVGKGGDDGRGLVFFVDDDDEDDDEFFLWTKSAS